jgi:hypothetical protein
MVRGEEWVGREGELQKGIHPTWGLVGRSVLVAGFVIEGK